MFCFWDKLNDTPELLGDDGEFWSYGEDSVAIDQGDEDAGRYWNRLCKISNRHALNDLGNRYEVYDPRLDIWCDISNTHIETFREIFKLAGAECYD